MVLIRCPECGRDQVSSVGVCPGCGCLVETELARRKAEHERKFCTKHNIARNYKGECSECVRVERISDKNELQKLEWEWEKIQKIHNTKYQEQESQIRGSYNQHGYDKDEAYEMDLRLAHDMYACYAHGNRYGCSECNRLVERIKYLKEQLDIKK
jgi:hypothetical protein